MEYHGHVGFSVIMPVSKQHLKYVDEAVSSVFNQIYPYWCLWIMDDTGCDAGIRLQYYQLHEEYNVIASNDYLRGKTPKVLGQSKRRNQAIEQINYSFITFLDADDIYMPDRLELAYNQIKLLPEEKKGKVFLYGDCVYFDHEKEWYWTPQTNIKRDDLLKSDCGIPIGSVTVSTELMKKYRFNEKLKIGEDWELYWRLMGEVEPVYIPQAHYLKRVGSTTCRKFPMSLRRWWVRHHLRKLAEKERYEASA